MSIPMCMSCMMPRPSHNPRLPPNSVKNTTVVGLANFVSEIVVLGDGTKSRKLLFVKLFEFWINLSNSDYELNQILIIHGYYFEISVNRVIFKKGHLKSKLSYSFEFQKEVFYKV